MDFSIIKPEMGSAQKFFALRKGEKYLIPKYPRRPTHLRVYGGKGSWGFSDEPGDVITKRGKFFKIPDDQVNYMKLPNYAKDDRGHNYGTLTWHII